MYKKNFHIKTLLFKGKKNVIVTPDSKSKSLSEIVFFFSFELNKKINHQ
jgi:hypothetical protein